jgi:hypothetical protein
MYSLGFDTAYCYSAWNFDPLMWGIGVHGPPEQVCCAARFDSQASGDGGMLTVETVGRLRRKHFVKGKTISSNGFAG